MHPANSPPSVWPASSRTPAWSLAHGSWPPAGWPETSPPWTALGTPVDFAKLWATKHTNILHGYNSPTQLLLNQCAALHWLSQTQTGIDLVNQIRYLKPISVPLNFSFHVYIKPKYFELWSLIVFAGAQIKFSGNYQNSRLLPTVWENN